MPEIHPCVEVEDEPRRLRLDLVLRDLDHDLEGATALVHVEDAAEADAPARSIATERFPALSVTRSDPTTTVALTLPDLTGARAPVIRVHVDTDGSGAVGPGDFINPTTISVPGPDVSTVLIELVQV